MQHFADPAAPIDVGSAADLSFKPSDGTFWARAIAQESMPVLFVSLRPGPVLQSRATTLNYSVVLQKAGVLMSSLFF